MKATEADKLFALPTMTEIERAPGTMVHCAGVMLCTAKGKLTALATYYAVTK